MSIDEVYEDTIDEYSKDSIERIKKVLLTFRKEKIEKQVNAENLSEFLLQYLDQK